MDIEQVQAAIGRYYSERSRSAAETIEELEELAEDIAMKIEGLRETIKNSENPIVPPFIVPKDNRLEYQ